MTSSRRDVSTICEDRVLSGTLVCAPSPSGAAVLFVHGLGSDRTTNLERAAAVTDRSGATCLAIDLGGHGRSTGRLSQMTPRRNLADVVAGYDLLATAPGVDPARIGVCAASYGAYLAVLLTGLRPVARMLLRAPALYADACFDAGLGDRLRGDPATAPTPLAHLALFRGPVTIVASGRDEVIPAGTIVAYRAALPTAAHVVQPDATHALTDPAWRADFQALVADFFAEI